MFYVHFNLDLYTFEVKDDFNEIVAVFKDCIDAFEYMRKINEDTLYK